MGMPRPKTRKGSRCRDDGYQGKGPVYLEVRRLSSLRLTVHRATNQIGGNCIEIATAEGQRIVLDGSAQNIDRTVTLYRACLKSGRTLAVDLYTAEVLELLADTGRLPTAGWDNLKVVITRAFSRLYESKGRGDFVERMAAHGVSAARLAENTEKWVIMIRPSLMRDMVPKGVTPTPDDAWSYSQWRGYLQQPDGIALKSWFDKGGAKAAHIHTAMLRSPISRRSRRR